MSKFLISLSMLLTAVTGALPANTCLFMLAGDCCHRSHVTRADCHAHGHSDAPRVAGGELLASDSILFSNREAYPTADRPLSAPPDFRIFVRLHSFLI